MQADPTLLRDWIDRAARRDPGKPWIVLAEGGRVVTYGELRQAISRIAAFLHGRGISANDRVALLATNSIEHLVCYFGVMAYGATICTVHVEMNRNQLGNIFARLKPALVLQQDGLGLDDLLEDVAAPRCGSAGPGWRDRRHRDAPRRGCAGRDRNGCNRRA